MMNNQLRLSHAQVRTILKLGQGHAPSTEYTNLGRPQTWQALRRKGIVEEVPFEELAFNKREKAEFKRWVRLTPVGQMVLKRLQGDRRKEPVIDLPKE